MDCADNDLDDVPSFSTGRPSGCERAPQAALPYDPTAAVEAQARLQIDALENAESHDPRQWQGMSELRLRTGIGGIGHSDKAHHAGSTMDGCKVVLTTPLSEQPGVLQEWHYAHRPADQHDVAAARVAEQVPVASWAANGYPAFALRAAKHHSPLSSATSRCWYHAAHPSKRSATVP